MSDAHNGTTKSKKGAQGGNVAGQPPANAPAQSLVELIQWSWTRVRDWKWWLANLNSLIQDWDIKHAVLKIFALWLWLSFGARVEWAVVSRSSPSYAPCPTLRQSASDFRAPRCVHSWQRFHYCGGRKQDGQVRSCSDRYCKPFDISACPAGGCSGRREHGRTACTFSWLQFGVAGTRSITLLFLLMEMKRSDIAYCAAPVRGGEGPCQTRGTLCSCFETRPCKNHTFYRPGRIGVSFKLLIQCGVPSHFTHFLPPHA